MRTVFCLLTAAFLLVSCAATGIKDSAYITDEEKEKVLRGRIAENFEAMVKRDKPKVYSLYDPFFRANISIDYFNTNMMRPEITYHGFEIVKTDIKGNIAAVDVKITYSIKHKVFDGKKDVNVENAERVLSETWLFMDGTWYRQFIEGLSDGTFAIY